MTTAINARHARPPVRRPPSRLAWAAGLIRLAVFLIFHPSAPLPGGLLNVRIQEAPRDIRVCLLEGMAYGYRTRTVRRFGMTAAERRFGPLVVEAHLKDEDYTAQLVRLAGNEAAA